MSARRKVPELPAELPENVVLFRPAVVPDVVVKQRPKRPKRAGSGLGKRPLRAVTAPVTLPEAVTSGSSENDSPNNTLQVVTSRIPVRVSPALSPSPAKPKRSVRTEFERQVRALKPMQLRERFPDEAACHKGMMARQHEGYPVHESIRAFRDFLLCLGPMLTPGLSIDRKDPEDREYAPGKIRWATARQQANNRTTTVFLEIRGERRSLSDWARLTGQKRNTLCTRHGRGWSDEEVVYGRKKRAPEPAAEPVELVEAEGYVWPGSQQAQTFWEEGFRGFVTFAQHHRRLRLHGPDALTRDAFLAWIGGNILDAARFELRERWPFYGDPDWDEPQELQEHLNYRIVGIYRWPVLEARCRALNSPAQGSLLKNTLKHYSRPTAPHRQNWGRVFSE